jgi:hypothetical protein
VLTAYDPKNGSWGASAALPPFRFAILASLQACDRTAVACARPSWPCSPHFHQETSIAGALHLHPNCRF